MTGDAGVELNASGEDEYGVNCSTMSPASDDKDTVIEEPLTTPIPPPMALMPRQSGCIRCPLTPDDYPKFFIRSQKTKEVIAPDKTSLEVGDQMLESTKLCVHVDDQTTILLRSDAS